jgi:acetyl esterase/lipase
VRPYTQEEGALDLARAVRYVRSHAQNYGIREKNIAVAGFSAGGILCGELLLHFKGKVKKQIRKQGTLSGQSSKQGCNRERSTPLLTEKAVLNTAP